MVRGLRLLTVLTSVSIALGSLEVGLAIVRPQPTYDRLLSMLSERYVPGEFLPFSLRPSFVAHAPSMEHPGQVVTLTTNSLGFRGPETSVEKPRGFKRVITLGDSYTFGVYTNDQDVYPRVLERRLRESGQAIEVINAAYADGWSPDEHYAWLKRRGLLFSPDLVVYGLFIGNDVPPDASVRNNWRDLDEYGLPTRIENPSIYVDAIGRVRSRLKDNRTVGWEQIYRVPFLRESHLAVLAGRTLEHRVAREPDISHYGFDLGSLRFLFDQTLSADQLAGEQILLRLVDGMNRFSLEHGSRFLVLLIPINFQVEDRFLDEWGNPPVISDYFSRLGRLLDERSVPYVDLLKAMRAKPGHYYPANGEVHFNTAGHRMAAEQLFESIAERQLLSDPPARNATPGR